MKDIDWALLQDCDAYHRRNSATERPYSDPVWNALTSLHDGWSISSLLEVGCSTGWRLQRAADQFGARCAGLDASAQAISDGTSKYPTVELRHGLAPRALQFWEGTRFECIVLGFFMYLLPRDDLFALAGTVDELLADGGHLIVYDFLYPTPIRTSYRHDPRLTTYKGDPSSPWLWSPTYSLIKREVHSSAGDAQTLDPANWITIDVLRKITAHEAYVDPSPSVGGLPA